MTHAMGPELREEAKRNRKLRKEARKLYLATMKKVRMAAKKKRTAAAKREREIERHGKPFFRGLKTVMARRAGG